MQELAAEIAELHHVTVDLIVAEELYALLFRHFVLVKAVPDVGVDEVRTLDGAAVIGDLPRAAGDIAVLLENLLVVFVELGRLGTIVDEVCAELAANKAERRADLRAVAGEDDLAVLKPLAGGQMLHHGDHIGDRLRRVRVVGHGVDDRDRAGVCQADDGFVLNDARHDDVHQTGENTAGVLDRLVSAELDHAGPEILRVTAELFHGGLKRAAGTGGGLLEDHAERHALHERGIVAGADGLFDGNGQIDDIHQFFLGKVIYGEKILFHCCDPFMVVFRIAE